MPQSNMVLHVDFPDWNSYSDPVKSLINFFMKDAAIYFQGDYTGSTLNSFSGNIRTKYRDIVSLYGDTDYFMDRTGVELNIAYTDTQPYPVEATGCLPNCTTTLTAKSSKLKLCLIDKTRGEDYDFFTASVFSGDGIEPIDTINVTLTPKIGDATNTDASATIHNMTSVSPLVTVPIKTANQDFTSEYQLRTSSLYLDDGNGNIAEDIFWKIGIVPFSKKYPKGFSGNPVDTPSTVASIKNILMGNEDGVLEIHSFGYGSTIGNDYTFQMQYMDFRHDILGNLNSLEGDLFGGDVPISFIVPIVPYGEDSQYIIGLAYARMFKSDGSLVTPEEVTGYNLKLYYKTSENDQNPQELEGYPYWYPLSITDQSMTGGYLQPLEPHEGP